MPKLFLKTWILIVSPLLLYGKEVVEPFSFRKQTYYHAGFDVKWRCIWFQTLLVDGKELYKQVLEISKTWKKSENLMYVVGATKAEYFTEI
jgi:orotidine-5'-phosphate decarboxylase